ncbi:MAG: ATP-binding protein [Flavobacteriales bacterium]
MKTKARLTLLLGVLLLLFTALAVLSLATIWRLRSEGTNVIKANYNSIAYMQAMLDALDTESDTERRSVRLKEQLDLQRANITEPHEAQATASLAVAVEALERAPSDATATFDLRRAIAVVLDLNRAAIVAKAEAQEQRGQRAVVWIGIAGTLGFLIAFSLFLSVPERIAEPIRKLTEGIDRIATGHYSERVEVQRRDEFGHLADRFNAMAAELERWQNSNLARIMAEKARAEAVINSLRDPSIGVDAQQRILFMNRQAAELLSVKAEELVGLDAEEAGRRNDLLARVLASNGSSTFKVVIDGQEQQFTVASSPIDPEHEHVGTVYSLHNVTPYLERDQAKTMFLATISHEMKTPLASSDIGLGLLERDGDLSSGQQAILVDLRKDHQRLVRIVSELLDMAQVESGRMRIRVRELPLKEIVDAAIEAVSSTANKERVILEVERPFDQATVMADSEKATWALVNLLSNAIRHTPAHGTVNVHVDHGTDRWRILVKDNGPGIPPELQKQLFERFVPHSASGTGLGLSIARDMMRAMGGDIILRSSDQSGAIFIMEFAPSL